MLQFNVKTKIQFNVKTKLVSQLFYTFDVVRPVFKPTSILSLFRNEFNKFSITRARMLDSIYHMA